jgi:hypothetical protein
MDDVKERRKERTAQLPSPLAFSVPEFCEAHRISRGLLYLMFRDGRGPRVMKAGRRTLITAEAAADWRRRMEVVSAEAA